MAACFKDENMFYNLCIFLFSELREYSNFRNGSAVELVGLSKSALKWLQKMKASGKYPYDSVTAKING